MKGFFVIAATAAILGWLTFQARTAEPQNLCGRWVFPLVRALHFLFFAVLAMGIAFVFFGFRGPENSRTTLVLIGVLFTIFPVVAWPKAVYLSESGLRQRTWWGKWKTLNWSELSDAKERPDNSLVLRGERVRIVFSRYHAGRQIFLDELRRNFPAKATLL